MSTTSPSNPGSDALALVDWIWKHFRSPQTWPVIRDIDRAADRELHRPLNDVLDEMPRWWLWPDLTRQPQMYQMDAEVRLTMLSMSQLRDGRPIAELAFKVVREIVAAADTFEPQTPNEELVILSDQIGDHLKLTSGMREALVIVGEFITDNDIPGIWRGFSALEGGRWRMTVDERGARPYRGLGSLDDLIAIVTRIRDSEELAIRQHYASISSIEAEVGHAQDAEETPADEESDDDGNDTSDPRNVFLVHGRNDAAKGAMVAFLEAIGLRPLDLERDLVPLAGIASPPILSLIIKGFEVAKAVVVLLTPDVDATLRVPFVRNPADQLPSPQARPNVYFEAGYAFHSHPERTVLVEVGATERLSDISNLLAVSMNNSESSRDAVIQRLKVAGCIVDIQNEDWKTAGDFDSAVYT